MRPRSHGSVPGLRDLYELELPHFINRNYDSMFDLGREPAALARLVRLGAFRRLAPTVASYFDDPRLQQIFSFQSLYAGLSPFEALAVYCVITYMDTVEGVYFPDGGMHEVARACRRGHEGGSRRDCRRAGRADLAPSRRIRRGRAARVR